jgi:hypothetical protein
MFGKYVHPTTAVVTLPRMASKGQLSIILQIKVLWFGVKRKPACLVRKRHPKILATRRNQKTPKDIFVD